MKSNAKRNEKQTKSSTQKKIIINILALVFVICVSITANNKIYEAKESTDIPVNIDSSTSIRNSSINNEDKIIKSGNMEYSIKDYEYVKDKNNPILENKSKYMVVKINIKNNGSTTEVFDAFDLKLEVTINGETKFIRNISDKTIYDIEPEKESEIKLIYIVPKNSTDIYITSEKDKNIRFKIDLS